MLVGHRNRRCALRYEHVPRGHGDAGEPGRGGVATVSGPMVGMSTRSSCPGFGAFTMHAGEPATAPVPAQFATAGKHGIGSLRRFDGDHMPVGDDGRLTHIEAAQRLNHLESPLDIGSGFRDGALAPSVPSPARSSGATSPAPRTR